MQRLPRCRHRTARSELARRNGNGKNLEKTPSISLKYRTTTQFSPAQKIQKDNTGVFVPSADRRDTIRESPAVRKGDRNKLSQSRPSSSTAGPVDDDLFASTARSLPPDSDPDFIVNRAPPPPPNSRRDNPQFNRYLALANKSPTLRPTRPNPDADQSDTEDMDIEPMDMNNPPPPIVLTGSLAPPAAQEEQQNAPPAPDVPIAMPDAPIAAPDAPIATPIAPAAPQGAPGANGDGAPMQQDPLADADAPMPLVQNIAGDHAALAAAAQQMMQDTQAAQAAAATAQQAAQAAQAALAAAQQAAPQQTAAQQAAAQQAATQQAVAQQAAAAAAAAQHPPPPAAAGPAPPPIVVPTFQDVKNGQPTHVPQNPHLGTQPTHPPPRSGRGRKSAVPELPPSQVTTVLNEAARTIVVNFSLGGQRLMKSLPNLQADVVQVISGLVSAAEFTYHPAIPAVRQTAGFGSAKYEPPSSAFVTCHNAATYVALAGGQVTYALPGNTTAFHLTTLDDTRMSWVAAILQTNDSRDPTLLVRIARAIIVTGLLEDPTFVQEVDQATQGIAGGTALERAIANALTVHVKHEQYGTNKPIYVVYRKPCGANKAANERINEKIRGLTIIGEHAEFVPMSTTSCVICLLDTHPAYMCPFVNGPNPWWGPPDQYSKITTGPLSIVPPDEKTPGGGRTPAPRRGGLGGRGGSNANRGGRNGRRQNGRGRA
ncbi:hypothetical protein C8J57DRAFT_1238485 [Mycena rebaudengoi]|nr:hypothetical protein C8J57DRAFT_1238485 [Mycena rebaudengoi]